MNYQEFAARTLNGNPELTELERLCNFLIGLAGEIAELGEVILSTNTPEKEVVNKEAGDTRWYIAACHSALAISETETAPSKQVIRDACYFASWEHGWYNLTTQAGKLLELCKKHFFHQNPKPRQEFVDCLTLLRAKWIGLVYEVGLKPEEVEQANIEKLMKRYPNGFNAADSAARRDTQEANQ